MDEGYKAGYRDGYADGVNSALTPMGATGRQRLVKEQIAERVLKASKPRRRKSKKVRILDEMAKKAWNKYKKGSGKKTYIQIRAQVSRSQAYKKKVKNL